MRDVELGWVHGVLLGLERGGVAVGDVGEVRVGSRDVRVGRRGDPHAAGAAARLRGHRVGPPRGAPLRHLVRGGNHSLKGRRQRKAVSLPRYLSDTLLLAILRSSEVSA